ncbi:exported hypothetical protein [Candidatus Zixiibacteriota bacterium]|nr:exported hypothetical protein [candidate division Zixibacteria bacterium]
MKLYRIILSVVIIIATISVWGAQSGVIDKNITPAKPAAVDNTSYIDANRIFMFVTNHGNMGRDLAGYFGYDYGTFFPYVGITDIQNGTTPSPLYAAGLWIGGKVGTETRVTVAGYGDEYVPGPMLGGTFQTDNPSFKIYKLYSDSVTNYDYLNWPVYQGAPAYRNGGPRFQGDQFLWSVFNDANPIEHQETSGMTAPLGLEVQQNTWAYSGAGFLGNIIFVGYKIYNKGTNHISDCLISFWADPDLGGVGDDLVGCDTLNNIFYCYNATNADQKYGSAPPAVGFKIIRGPLVPSINDTARFERWFIPGFRNLDMTSFAKYINGTDPLYAQQSYNCMLGLSRQGDPYIFDGRNLKYQCSGDPVLETGDLDSSPADRRMMASCGPFDFNPGDSQYVLIAMGVGQGTDRLNSIAVLEDILNSYQLSENCADRNGDGRVGLDDLMGIIDALYAGGNPALLADVNNDRISNILDISYLINYLFRNGPSPQCPL